jgi:hypothetical protein
MGRLAAVVTKMPIKYVVTVFANDWPVVIAGEIFVVGFTIRHTG